MGGGNQEMRLRRRPPLAPRLVRRPKAEARRSFVVPGVACVVVVLLLTWSSPDGWLTTSHMSFRQKAGDFYWLVRSAYSRSTVTGDEEARVFLAPKDKKRLSKGLDVGAAKAECKSQETFLAMHLKVPKAASTTVFDLLYALHHENHFAIDSRPIYISELHEGRTRREYAAYLSSFRVKTVRTAHCPYVDLGKLGYPRPAYFGLVREPIKRLRSHYEYLHWGPRSRWATFWKGQDVTAPSFDQCVASHEKNKMRIEKGDCLYWANAQLAYFCGFTSKRCPAPQEISVSDDAGRRAFTQATRNVDRDFVAVGVVERLHDALFVFEHILPAYFRDARRASVGLVSRANNASNLLQRATKSSSSPTPPPQQQQNHTAFLRRVLAWEYNFYDKMALDFEAQFQACRRRGGGSIDHHHHHHHHREEEDGGEEREKRRLLLLRRRRQR